MEVHFCFFFVVDLYCDVFFNYYSSSLFGVEKIETKYVKSKTIIKHFS